MTLDVSVWYCSYLLKDNFKLCEVSVPLRNLGPDAALEGWHRLTTCY